MDGLPAPPRARIPPLVADLALALGLASVMLIWSLAGAAGHPRGHPVEFAVAVAAALGLAVRRRWPVEVFALAAAAVFLQGAAGVGQLAGPTLLIAVYTVSTRRPRATALVVAGVAVLALTLGPVERGVAVLDPPVISRAGTVAAAAAIGLYFGTRRAYVQALRERAEQLARERTMLAERAVDDERVRIARELHDLVAHHVTLLTVQAGAVRETLAADHPGRPVLDSMSETGRQALAEMRRMLDLLRPDAAAPEHAPQPGLAQIGALVDQTRAAGIPVRLSVEGAPRDVSEGIGLSAYRIVQEGLTNVVKHAGPARAEVVVRYGPGVLELTVSDDGRGAAAANGGGHGLVGMRERVALFGGDLAAGAAPGGGYVVRAVLPTGEDAA